MLNVMQLKMNAVVCLGTTETVWRCGYGWCFGPSQLVEFPDAGQSQPLPEHRRRQPHDPSTTPRPAGEGQGPDPRRGAENRGRQ